MPPKGRSAKQAARNSRKKGAVLRVPDISMMSICEEFTCVQKGTGSNPKNVLISIRKSPTPKKPGEDSLPFQKKQADDALHAYSEKEGIACDRFTIDVLTMPNQSGNRKNPGQASSANPNGNLPQLMRDHIFESDKYDIIFVSHMSRFIRLGDPVMGKALFHYLTSKKNIEIICRCADWNDPPTKAKPYLTSKNPQDYRRMEEAIESSCRAWREFSANGKTASAAKKLRRKRDIRNNSTLKGAVVSMRWTNKHGKEVPYKCTIVKGTRAKKKNAVIYVTYDGNDPCIYKHTRAELIEKRALRAPVVVTRRTNGAAVTSMNID